MTEDGALVAFCGLYCGDCKIRKGDLADQAKKLAAELEEANFECQAYGLAQLIGVFKPLTHYREFRDALHALDNYRCSATCRQGGGTSACLIRKCCLEKKLDGCWRCSGFESCRTLAWLAPLHGEAHLNNLRIIRDQGMEEFLNGPKQW